jgi:hypothetical protein
MRVRSVALAAIIALAPVSAGAQQFQIGFYPEGYFTAIDRAWTFGGCLQGRLGVPGSRDLTSGQVACYDGLVTLGRRPEARRAHAVGRRAHARRRDERPRGRGQPVVRPVLVRVYVQPHGALPGLHIQPVGQVGGPGTASFTSGIRVLGDPRIDPASVAPIYAQLAFSYRVDPPTGEPFYYAVDEVRTFTLTPEPSTLALAGAGLLALGAAARRRRA